jgi:hypothetical protein
MLYKCRPLFILNLTYLVFEMYLSLNMPESVWIGLSYINFERKNMFQFKVYQFQKKVKVYNIYLVVYLSKKYTQTTYVYAMTTCNTCLLIHDFYSPRKISSKPSHGLFGTFCKFLTWKFWFYLWPMWRNFILRIGSNLFKTNMCIGLYFIHPLS